MELFDDRPYLISRVNGESTSHESFGQRIPLISVEKVHSEVVLVIVVVQEE